MTPVVRDALAWRRWARRGNTIIEIWWAEGTGAGIRNDLALAKERPIPMRVGMSAYLPDPPLLLP